MNIIDVLAERACKRIDNHTLSEIILSESYTIENYLKDIYKLLQSKDYYSKGVKNLCFACDLVSKDNSNIYMLKQCIQSSRIFLYQDMLEKKIFSRR